MIRTQPDHPAAPSAEQLYAKLQRDGNHPLQVNPRQRGVSAVVLLDELDCRDDGGLNGRPEIAAHLFLAIRGLRTCMSIEEALAGRLQRVAPVDVS